MSWTKLLLSSTPRAGHADASRGLGKAIALELARDGVMLALVGWDEPMRE